MNNDFIEMQLDHIPSNDRDALLKLLGCARQFPGEYYLKESVGVSKNRPAALRLVLPTSDIHEPCDRQNFEGTSYLLHSQLLVPELSVPNSYRFSDDLDGWFRETYPPTAHDVQKWLGQKLYELHLSQKGRVRPGMFIDPDELISDYGMSRGQLDAQFLALKDWGFVKFNGHAENQLEDGYAKLTDDGLRWAISGFPPLSTEALIHVSVDLTNVIHIINEIPPAEVSDDQKQEFISLLESLQEEPTTEKAARVMGMAANLQALVPAVIGFFGENGHLLEEIIKR